MVRVFEKYLTYTDINHGRLSFPTEHLGKLPPFKEGRHDVEFYVSYRYESPCQFRCIKREGEYAKPTVSQGWSEVVRNKRLSIDDKLVFHIEEQDVPRYWIEVYRNISGDWTLIE